jgi:hypothetical protein
MDKSNNVLLPSTRSKGEPEWLVSSDDHGSQYLDLSASRFLIRASHVAAGTVTVDFRTVPVTFPTVNGVLLIAHAT